MERIAELVAEAYDRVEAGLLPARLLPPRDYKPIALYDDKTNTITVYVTNGAKN
jgi:hypothetical protein